MIFPGGALLQRMSRLDLLGGTRSSTTNSSGLTTAMILEGRLQIKVFRMDHVKTSRNARVLMRQRHIPVGSQVVNIQSFLVRTDREKRMDFAFDDARPKW